MKMYRFIFICCVSVITATVCSPLCKRNMLHCFKNNPAVRRLQEYIRIDTSSSQNLELSTEFWRRQANDLGLEFAVYRPAGLPICVLTWRGSNPDLPSIMLNTHADVVPVYESLWTYPPFDAHIDDNGDLYGRGTQDTKSEGIEYLEAIRKLKQNKVVLQRTLHVTVMPDEETGGFNGMIPFVRSEEFKSLNIGFAIDEGATSSDNTLYATYVDKRPWRKLLNAANTILYEIFDSLAEFKLTMRGEGGHSLTVPTDTSAQKLYRLLDLTLKFREEQRLIQISNPPTEFGSYTALNVNYIQGGVAVNVIPANMTAIVDMRLSFEATVEETQALIDSWIQALGNGTTIEYIRRIERSEATPLKDNPFWMAMLETAKDLDLTLLPSICPAASDMIPLRNIGIPALGFSPKRNMVSRVHNNDEYIPVANFLEGIEIYVAMLQKLGNLD